MSLPNWGCFHSLFLQVLSLPTLFILLFWDSGDVNVTFFQFIFSVFIFFSLFSHVV